MCGIAGFLTADEPFGGGAATVTKMASTLKHRGPDEFGTWCDPARGVAFGHCRLAVVGLGDAGSQPMASTSGRWVINYNGEVYNHRSLRTELQRLGASFRGSSDTEVLVEAIDLWGIDRAVERADGMFAFAAWDRSQERLFLVRDRFGEKPLYYGWVDSTLLFGSELRALAAHPDFHPEPDEVALHAYFDFGYVPTPRTVYAGISKLPPGSLYETDRSGRAALRVWWDPAQAARESADRPFPGGPAEAVDELHTRLRTSVADRMVADVPVGALLSGGLDSSAVVMLASEVGSSPVKTFSVGFSQGRFDESGHARRVADIFGTDHTVMQVSELDAMNLVPDLVEIWDEPFSDSSQIPTYLVSALARAHVTVALTGDGGDELFGGYDRYRFLHRLLGISGWLDRVPSRPARSLIGGAARAAVVLGNEPLARRLNKAVGLVGLKEPNALYRQLMTTGSGFAARGLHHLPPLDPLESWDQWPGSVVTKAMGTDTVSYLPDDILVKVDRATMARSLESRLPFLSESVFQFAWSLPDELRWDGVGGKTVLRGLLSGHLPPDLVSRPKQGFGVPLGEWLRSGLRPWANELILDRALEVSAFVDVVSVRRAWDAHVAGRGDHASKIWPVLMFEAWRRGRHPEWCTR